MPGKPCTPSPLGVPWGDGAALGVDVAAIDAGAAHLREQVDDGRLPGFMTCTIKEGKLLHFEAYGQADVCGKVPMRADTIFRLYSQTKPVLLVGFMRLVEKGLVHLDDPVSKYIPAFRKVGVGKSQRPLARPVVVQDLLGHTCGVGFGPGFGYPVQNSYEKDYADLVYRVDRQEVKSLADWCDQLLKLPLRFQPGKDWGYGYSSDILGRVVEIASGRPLDKYLQAEVIDPLGMSDTHFALPHEKAKRLATLYRREPKEPVAADRNRVRFVTIDVGGSGLIENESKRVYALVSDGSGTVAPSASVFLKGGMASKVIQGGGCVCSVGGGLVSSMRDYARFSQLLVNNGELDGVRLLKPESVRLLFADFLNEYTAERRRAPFWTWGQTGIGFAPLGQVGVEHKDVENRRRIGSALHTVHWGGAGGSGYMFNLPHKVIVLTYTGCIFDTATQKTMWRATFGALRRGGAKPAESPLPLPRLLSSSTFSRKGSVTKRITKKRSAEIREEDVSKRRRKS